MDKKLNLMNKLYPWYLGLSTDLIFYIAINTIWLTSVKGFSNSQITFLSTISSLFTIIFLMPLLKIIKRLGNTKSIRIGSFLLLISSITFTFGNNYLSLALADILLEISLIFQMMSAILIKNNLEYQNMNDKYVKIRSNASLIYAISTAIITLFIGILFNIHKYLPMILGIITCLFCFICSFFIFDINDKYNDNITNKIVIPKPYKLFLLIITFYGLTFGIIIVGQQNGKLLIQDKLIKLFTIEKVASYLGIIVFISRLIRVINNYLYPKLYKKLNNKINILLQTYLIISLTILLIGYYLNINWYIKILIMTLGFSVFPSLREPMNIYTQKFILDNFNSEYQKNALIFMSFARHIGKFIFSLLASFILLKLPLYYLFIIFTIIVIPLIYISIKINLYSKRL